MFIIQKKKLIVIIIKINYLKDIKVKYYIKIMNIFKIRNIFYKIDEDKEFINVFLKPIKRSKSYDSFFVDDKIIKLDNIDLKNKYEILKSKYYDIYKKNDIIKNNFISFIFLIIIIKLI